ncbi:hypothetical protein S7335_661 [Synechococcus sp. PCC 7335]|nr:hypothetical protein S7335_661 [Synechococcus sp. PCC 7335]
MIYPVLHSPLAIFLVIFLARKMTRKNGCLTLQTAKIAPATTAMRCLDWARDCFDIESELKNDTTYNSFLFREEKTALLGTSHHKFREQSLEYVSQQIAPLDLPYLIVNYTGSGHSGLIKEILDWAPHVIVAGSKLAIQFLENMLHRPFASPFASVVIKSGHHLDLGRGHELKFLARFNSGP